MPLMLPLSSHNLYSNHDAMIPQATTLSWWWRLQNGFMTELCWQKWPPPLPPPGSRSYNCSQASQAGRQACRGTWPMHDARREQGQLSTGFPGAHSCIVRTTLMQEPKRGEKEKKLALAPILREIGCVHTCNLMAWDTSQPVFLHWQATVTKKESHLLRERKSVSCLTEEEFSISLVLSFFLHCPSAWACEQRSPTTSSAP